MSNIVPPSGDPASKICILGARPGRYECITGQPFSGDSGELLWRLLGLPREQCYVTNVRKDHSFKFSEPTKAETREVLADLRAELQATQANVIIALGGAALQAVSNFEKTSIDHWRGSIIDSALSPGKKVVATFHPAACLHGQYQLRYVIEHDLRRARREAAYPDIRRPVRTFHINPGFDEAIHRLRNLRDPIVVDIETFGENISCVGFADSPSEALCIGFVGSHYSTSELAVLFREIDKVLRTRRIIGQNIQFDTTRLERLGFQLTHLHHDTMLSHHLLWTELGMQVKRKQGDRGIDSLSGKHSLAFISSIYTSEPYYKHESELAWLLPGLELGERFERYWTYNLKDCCTTYESFLGLDNELDKYGQRDYYNRHVMGLIRPVMHMQSHGLLVDLDRLGTVRQRLLLETSLLQTMLNRQVGFEINVKSPKDLVYLISDVLHLPRAKLTKGGAPSTDEDTLRSYAFTTQHSDLFSLILDIRERRTLLSGFLNLEVDQDGRYKANYLIHGTDSGRLASRAVRKGPQLQNIPYPTRKIFVAPPGSVFTQGDLGRAEATYVAFDAQCRALIEAYTDPTRDLYSEVASEALGIQVSKTRNVWARDLFKRVIHGSNYKMGPLKFVAVLRLAGIDILKLPVPGKSGKAKAEYVQGFYLKKYPELAAWQRRIGDEAKSRILHDSFGRRRMFLGYMDDNLVRAACSYKPQATIVGIANLAIQTLDAQGWKLVAQTHDSIMIENPITQLHEAANALRKALSLPITLHGRTFTIPVDVMWGRSWGELEPYVDSQGEPQPCAA